MWKAVKCYHTLQAKKRNLFILCDSRTAKWKTSSWIDRQGGSLALAKIQFVTASSCANYFNKSWWSDAEKRGIDCWAAALNCTAPCPLMRLRLIQYWNHGKKNSPLTVSRLRPYLRAILTHRVRNVSYILYESKKSNTVLFHLLPKVFLLNGPCCWPPRHIPVCHPSHILLTRRHTRYVRQTERRSHLSYSCTKSLVLLACDVCKQTSPQVVFGYLGPRTLTFTTSKWINARTRTEQGTEEKEFVLGTT